MFHCDKNGRPLPQDSQERIIAKPRESSLPSKMGKVNSSAYMSSPVKMRKEYSESSSEEKLKKM